MDVVIFEVVLVVYDRERIESNWIEECRIVDFGVLFMRGWKGGGRSLIDSDKK